MRDHADLIYSIQVKINNLEALNKVLGDTLKENLNKKGLDKLSEKSKVEKSSIASLKEPDFLDLEVPKETTPQDDRPVLATSVDKFSELTRPSIERSKVPTGPKTVPIVSSKTITPEAAKTPVTKLSL